MVINGLFLLQVLGFKVSFCYIQYELVWLLIFWHLPFAFLLVVVPFFGSILVVTLLNLLQLVFLNELLTHGFLIVIKKTKFEVVDFASVIKVYFFKNKAIVGHRDVNAHFYEPGHELLKVQSSIKIFIESSEPLAEPFKLLKDSKTYMLQKQIDSGKILGRTH